MTNKHEFGVRFACDHIVFKSISEVEFLYKNIEEKVKQVFRTECGLRSHGHVSLAHSEDDEEASFDSSCLTLQGRYLWARIASRST